MSNEPICIRRTITVEEASIVVSWLQERGIDARVVDPSSTGVFAFGVTDPEGVEVYVADAATAERAKAMLEEHDKDVQKHIAAHMTDPPIQVACNECGQRSSFPPDTAGSVQECPYCGSYLDVPGDKNETRR